MSRLQLTELIARTQRHALVATRAPLRCALALAVWAVSTACSEPSRGPFVSDHEAGGAAEANTLVAEPAAMTYVFVCPDRTEYVIRTTAIEAWVFRPTGSLRLPATGMPAGSAYAGDGFVLRIEGEQAQLGADTALKSCQNDRRRAIWEQAKLDGADFRAVGNEPGWVLEIQAQSRIVLLADYGQTRIELPLPTPTEDREGRTSRWDAGELQLEVVGRPCSDTMSGEEFESEVTISWQGRTLRGCGRALH